MEMAFGLCQYKNMFGEPNTGVHSYRVLNLAITDVSMTIVGALLLAYFFKWNMVYTVAGAFLFGIVLHRLFCVRTTVDKFLFPSA
jgi:fatty acid desaturase